MNIFEHELFAGEPYSDREAWIWLISKAAWKETKHRVGNNVYDVPVGGLFVTIRQLQEAWKWRSTKRVHAFLNMLKRETMIETRTETGKTFVSICNYEKYQVAETEMETQRKQERKHEGNTKDTITPNTSLRSVSKAREEIPFREILEPVMRPDILDDFCIHRRKKKASFTATAAKMFLKNAADCKMSPDKAAITAIDRNWITVKPDWIFKSQSPQAQKPEPRNIGERAALKLEERLKNAAINARAGSEIGDERGQGNGAGAVESIASKTGDFSGG